MRVMDIHSETRFCPADFHSDRYTGLTVFNRKHRAPVIVLMSKSCNPPHYLVVDGIFKQMFYLNYTDAIAYCERMGYTSP